MVGRAGTAPASPGLQPGALLSKLPSHNVAEQVGIEPTDCISSQRFSKPPQLTNVWLCSMEEGRGIKPRWHFCRICFRNRPLVDRLPSENADGESLRTPRQRESIMQNDELSKSNVCRGLIPLALYLGGGGESRTPKVQG